MLCRETAAPLTTPGTRLWSPSGTSAPEKPANYPAGASNGAAIASDTNPSSRWRTTRHRHHGRADPPEPARTATWSRARTGTGGMHDGAINALRGYVLTGATARVAKLGSRCPVGMLAGLAGQHRRRADEFGVRARSNRRDSQSTGRSDMTMRHRLRAVIGVAVLGLVAGVLVGGS